MRLKLYRASTTAGAIAQVRAELGADALILGTRRLDNGFEVTAALEEEEPPPPAATGGSMLGYHAIPPDIAIRLGHGPLDTALARTLRFVPLPLDGSGSPLLLVGPPGAGKTLTTARLATRLVMHRQTPLVITADGKRAGAAEQLAAFTKLLGLGLVAASHPVTLGRALTRRLPGAPVLIDTAGIDPFDPAQADELRGALAATQGTAALVLPAGLDPGESTDLALAFAEAGASLLIATRLDLARRLGGIVAAATHLPLTEAGIGPGAADGLVPLTAAILAERLLQTGHTRHANH